ncbi:MAG: hypothetical protein AAF170_13030 [Bacteroidota bacterium]
MPRFALVGFVLLTGVLAGCAEPADAPGVDEQDDPVIETAAEMAVEEAEPQEEGFDFRVEGELGPIATYALDDDAECIAYDTHIVRLTPVEDADGHTIEIVARPEGTSPLDVCEAEAEGDLPTRAGVDTFVELDGTVLWTVSDARGRDRLTGYDVEAGDEVFGETVTPPAVKTADGLVYGGPPETMADMDALDAASVPCPEAAAWFADGQTVAISRRLMYSFESGETTDAGEALCFTLDDA